MKGKLIYIIISTIIFSTDYLSAQDSVLWNTDSSFYFYKVNYSSNTEKLIADKIVFDSKLNKKEILESIASFLSETYFLPESKYFEDKKKIEIKIQDIIEINLSERNLLIAVVNIDDPDEICITTYFQGSTGGHNTFLMLVSNLIQPQLEFPLLDGVVILYNGDELKNMDHINLEGLISEREIDNSVKMALRK